MFLCVYVRASSICIQVRARAYVDILNVFTAVDVCLYALFSNEMFIDCLFILIVATTEPFFVCHGNHTAEPKGDKCLISTSHFSPFNCCSGVAV